jgi:hypothetical protein
MQIKMFSMVRSSGLKWGPRDFDVLVPGKMHFLERWRGIIKQVDRGKWRECMGSMWWEHGKNYSSLLQDRKIFF